MKTLKKRIDELSKKSEAVRGLCDAIRITSQREIAGLHAGKRLSLSKMRKDVKKLGKTIKEPILYALNKSSVLIAYQEYAEAELLKAIMDKKKLPSLNIPAPCYFTGLCDAIGEVKRQFMIALIEGNKKKASYLLKRSLELGSTIAEIDAPPSVIKAIKPKKDMVQRSIESMLELSVRNK